MVAEKPTDYNLVKVEFKAELLYWIALDCTHAANKVASYCHIKIQLPKRLLRQLTIKYTDMPNIKKIKSNLQHK